MGSDPISPLEKQNALRIRMAREGVWMLGVPEVGRGLWPLGLLTTTCCEPIATGYALPLSHPLSSPIWEMHCTEPFGSL